MYFLLILGILLILNRLSLRVAHAGSIKYNGWEGETCLYGNDTKTVVNILLHNSAGSACFDKTFMQFDADSKCSMWATGKFLHTGTRKDTGLSGDTYDHRCYSRPASTLQQRSAHRTTLMQKVNSTGNPRFLVEQGKYYCDEELPIGFHPIKSDHSQQQMPLVDAPMQWYSRSEIYEHLKGKTLMFSGNSMTRQLFQRFILYLRGVNWFAERSNHSAMIYGFDQKVDFWKKCPSVAACLKSTEFWGHFENKSNVAVAAYFYANKNNDCPKTMLQHLERMVLRVHTQMTGLTTSNVGIIQQMTTFSSDSTEPAWYVSKSNRGALRFQPVMNCREAIEKTDNESDLIALADNILRLDMQLWSVRNQRIQPTLPGWPARVGVIYSPTEEERASLSVANGSNVDVSGSSKFIGSTAAVAAATVKAAVNSPPTARPGCEFFDDAHYQCGILHPPSTVLPKFKFPLDRDCSDTFNLNVIQRMFMFLFDKRVGSA